MAKVTAGLGVLKRVVGELWAATPAVGLNPPPVFWDSGGGEVPADPDPEPDVEPEADVESPTGVFASEAVRQAADDRIRTEALRQLDSLDLDGERLDTRIEPLLRPEVGVYDLLDGPEGSFAEPT